MNKRKIFLTLLALTISAYPLVSVAAKSGKEITSKSTSNINDGAGVALPTQPVEVKKEHSFFDWFASDNEPAETSSEVAGSSKNNNVKVQAPEVVIDDAAVNEAIADSQNRKLSKPKQITGHDLEIARLETYLNSLTTIVSDFTQIAPDGSLTTGKFYLKRPGKMRWEYNPPTPILMVSSGSTLVYYDSELQQVSHIPMGSTLASFLAREHIDLSDPKLRIDSLSRAAGVLRITISQTDKQEEGSVMLEFSDMPLQIRNMVVTDTERQVTTISLNKAQFGKPLPKSLFVWVDPRKKK